MKDLRIILYIVLTVWLTACSKTASSNVKTTGMHVTFSIEGNNQNAATCRAEFQVGGPTGTYLELDSGDTVTCQGQSMWKSEFAGMVTYYASVPFVPGGNYSVTFKRPDEPAYTSSVILPAAISGMNPLSFQSYLKGQAFAVYWTPSSSGLDTMNVGLSFSSLNGSYYTTKSGGRPELGVVGFGAYDTTANPSNLGAYSGTLTYERYRAGNVSSPLSGSFYATQKFQVPIELRD